MHFPAFHFHGSGGKGGHTPTEAPDSIFTNQTARVLDLLSEGEIEGIVGGQKGIYYNEVPLQQDSGTFNFTGASVAINTGTTDQAVMPGFTDTQSTVSVSQQMDANVYKTISFVNDGSVTAAVVTVSGGPFFKVQDDGDLVGTSVSFVIEVSENGGAFASRGTFTIRGVQHDTFSLDYRVPIGNTSGNTAIRVKRTTAAATSSKVQDVLTFANYTKIVEYKFNYPNYAMVGHVIEAKQFGNKIPTRQYRAKGIKCRIPSNYDPVARTYTGAWDGTFKTTKYYTNNASWVYLELVTNKRFGLGQYFPEAYVDLPSLYTLAKWLDAYEARFPVGTPGKTNDYDPVTGCHGVPDGKGGFEPRWTCNAWMTTRGEAFSVLKELVSGFRGNLFWMQAKLWAFGDGPRTAVKVVNNANVIGGKFTYSGDSNRQRRSVYNITFNDPDLFYRRGIETVEDGGLIREIGYKDADFGAFGCTSRSQAHRMGKALLFTQEFESSLVSYRASFDHMAVTGSEGPDGIAPGDMILIADREVGNARSGGRIIGPYSAEMVTNGSVGTNTAGWTADAAQTTLTSTGGRLRVTNTTTSSGYAYQQITGLVVGQTYRFKVNVYQGNQPTIGCQVEVGTTQGGGQLYQQNILGAGNNPAIDVSFVATATTVYVSLTTNNAAAGTYAEFDNISLVGQVANKVVLDRNVGLLNGTGKLYIEHALDGSIEWVNCTYTTADLNDTTQTIVTLTAAPTSSVAANDLFILVDSGFDAVPYIVLKISETAKNECEITAVRWDETRWNAIYGDPVIETQNYMSLPQRDDGTTANSGFTSPPAGPLNYADQYITSPHEGTVRYLQLFWTKSTDPYLDHYVVRYAQGETEYRTLPATTSVSARVPNAGDGVYNVQVFAVNKFGVFSAPLEATFTLASTPDAGSIPVGTISNLHVIGGAGLNFAGTRATIGWNINTPTALAQQAAGIAVDTGHTDRTFRDVLVTVKNNVGSILRQEAVIDNFYTYTRDSNHADSGGSVSSALTFEVQYRDVFGRLSTAATIAVDNAAPGLPTGIAVTAGPLSNYVKWTKPTDADLDYVEVLANTTNNSGTATSIAKSAATSLVHSGLTAGQNWYYWLKSVDVWGNASALTAVAGPITVQSVSGYDTVISNLVDDDVLDPTEKAGPLAQIYADLEARYQTLLARAQALGLSTTAMDTARTNWRALISSFSPSWSDTSQSTRVYTPWFGDQNFPAGWSNLNGLTTAANGVYTTLTDPSGTLPSSITRTKAQVAAATQYSFGIPVKKDSVPKTTRYVAMLANFTGGTAKQPVLSLDTSTGEVASSNAAYAWDAFGVLDLGDDWFIWGTATTNPDNTFVALFFYPAYGSTATMGTAMSTANQAISKTGSADVRTPALSLGDWKTLGRPVIVGQINAFVAEQQKIGKAVSEYDATVANWGTVNSRPANLSALIGTEGIKNSLVQIGANGALSGAGGGQVLLTGAGSLGGLAYGSTGGTYTGDLDSERNSRMDLTQDTGGTGGRVRVRLTNNAVGVGTLTTLNDAVQNVGIGVFSGLITGIGTGNNTAVGNSLVQIGANGALSGAGGGQVTIGGLGYSGDLDAEHNSRLDLTQDTGGTGGRVRARLTNNTTGIGSFLQLSDGVQNVGISVSSGLISGIGSGNNAAVGNSLVQIGANGALSGAGGGQVTITGLGYSGDLDAQRNSRILISNGVLSGIGTSNVWVDNSFAATQAQNTRALFFNQNFDLVTPGSNAYPLGVYPIGFTAEQGFGNLGYDGGTLGGDFSFGSIATASLYVTVPFWRCNPRSTYRVRGRVKAASAIANGFSLTFVEKDSEPSSQALYMASNPGWAGSSLGTAPTRNRTGANTALTGGDGLNNVALTTAYQSFDIQITPTSTAKFMSIVMVRSSTQPNVGVSLAELVIEEIMPTSVTQFDYTGDLNATLGAAWSTNLTGRPTELTDGRVSTAINSSGNISSPIRVPPIVGAGLRYKVTGAVSYGSTTSTQSTITHSGTVVVGGTTYTYSSSSVVVTGAGTQTFYVYVTSNPFSNGTHTLLATTNALTPYQDDNAVYLGSVTITFTSGGSGGGDLGGGQCVWEGAYVHTLHGWLLATAVKVGDILRVLSDDRQSLRWEPVQSIEWGIEPCFTIYGLETGIEVTVSKSTPITLRDGTIIRPWQIAGGVELPFEAGNGLWWEPCHIRYVGPRRVAKIKCNQKTYSAGNSYGQGILTHNPKP